MTAFDANFVLVNLVLNNEKYAIFHVEYLRVWPPKTNPIEEQLFINKQTLSAMILS